MHLSDWGVLATNVFMEQMCFIWDFSDLQKHSVALYTASSYLRYLDDSYGDTKIFLANSDHEDKLII